MRTAIMWLIGTVIGANITPNNPNEPGILLMPSGFKTEVNTNTSTTEAIMYMKKNTLDGIRFLITIFALTEKYSEVFL